MKIRILTVGALLLAGAVVLLSSCSDVLSGPPQDGAGGQDGGSGTAVMTIGWRSETPTFPMIHADLQTASGGTEAVDFTLDDSGKHAEFSRSLPEGSYILSVRLFDGATPLWGTATAFTIGADAGPRTDWTLTGLFSFDTPSMIIDNAGSGGSRFRFQGRKTVLEPGRSMTVTADVPPDIESFQWYIDGEVLGAAGGATVSLGQALGTGAHRLDLVTERNGSVQSDGFSFVVLPSGNTPYRPVLFTSDETHDWNVYKMNSDGTATERLSYPQDPEYAVYNDGNGYDPAWSPDGTLIAYATYSGDYDGVFIMNADGSNPHSTSGYSWDDQDAPAWSPDGTAIACTDHFSGKIIVKHLGAPSFEQPDLTEPYTLDTSATWSPDGTRIAFETNRDGNREIYVMDTDGGNLKNLSNDPSNDYSPAWAPDGRIAFVSDRDGNAEVYLMDIAGENARNISRNPAADIDPAWSTDGRKIAFSSDRDSAGANTNYEIYVMNADGSGQTNLTRTPDIDERQPAW